MTEYSSSIIHIDSSILEPIFFYLPQCYGGGFSGLGFASALPLNGSVYRSLYGCASSTVVYGQLMTQVVTGS